ncbi:hypothetical protein EVAR_53919_1 [Eumeta japonica]|uniref:Uncharacterized protein n=1 Tax=Eumeta variegata TaxID=151549 RepID=A0A4C1YI50_EUMVA|nr:hypothetical protein EVAR_53919_1 [Eumeta japonica]
MTMIINVVLMFKTYGLTCRWEDRTSRILHLWSDSVSSSAKAHPQEHANRYIHHGVSSIKTTSGCALATSFDSRHAMYVKDDRSGLDQESRTITDRCAYRLSNRWMRGFVVEEQIRGSAVGCMLHVAAKHQLNYVLKIFRSPKHIEWERWICVGVCVCMCAHAQACVLRGRVYVHSNI